MLIPYSYQEAHVKAQAEAMRGYAVLRAYLDTLPSLLYCVGQPVFPYAAQPCAVYIAGSLPEEVTLCTMFPVQAAKVPGFR